MRQMDEYERNDDRREVVDYLSRQIVGPFDGEEELLYFDRPSARYLMGTLYPQDSDAGLVLPEESGGNSGADTEEVDDAPLSMVFQRMPASMGLSFYVQDCNKIEIGVYAGCYSKVTKKDIDTDKSLPVDKRKLKEHISGESPKWVRKTLATGAAPEILTVTPEYKHSLLLAVLDDKAKVHVVWRRMGEGALLTVTLMNAAHQEPGEKVEPEMCLYQAGIICRPLTGSMTEYPAVTRLSYDDEEEELALQYKNNITYAVGHGCAAVWAKSSTPPDSVRTTWMPQAEVKPVTTMLEEDGKSAVLGIQYLADTGIGSDKLGSDLGAFVNGYAEWCGKIIAEQVDEKYEVPKERITARIEEAVIRMRAGVKLLQENKKVRQAFALANSAMLRQMIHTGSEYGGSIKKRNEFLFKKPDYTGTDYKNFLWRPFQLAFQLLVLESLVNPDTDDRNVVDLLWFPTGGGKTEAYLALAAFELIYRRIIFGENGAGTVVIKRYTLRLLTTQQFQRAATLICALEIMRRDNATLLGATPFTLGLWVGEASSPNKYTSNTSYSKGAFELYAEMRDQDQPENYFQLQQCPWCGTAIVPKRRSESAADYGVKATQTTFDFYCPSDECELHESIPVTVVDEDIYENPPSFVIGTVDKFARLAWDDRASGMFGDAGANHRPPSLIIQDELHLISGPLGTIAGVYEAAISTLIESKGIKPKIIAATATIRRAGDQVERLYGASVSIFPPPGISADNSYFSRVDHDAPGRLYIGIMGQGHTAVTSLVHVSAVLSQSLLESNISDSSMDSWWTQVIYHNSRRELGKTMTLCRDDIPERVRVIATDENRIRQLENIDELSANIRGLEIPEVLSRLSISNPDKNAIDMLPCTNMISVGVDVSRLGMMLIVGQPKSTAEYIQASSRVGRSDEFSPGIVVTLYSGAKPRDRSHYENFIAYHGALYRAVEPTSVTPFAPPSRDRALHAALVIVMRHAGGLGSNPSAEFFNIRKKNIHILVNELVERMVKAEPSEEVNIRRHMDKLIVEWKRKIEEARKETRPLRYENRGGAQFSSLLCHFNETDGEGWPTLNSMRNVDMESLVQVAGEDA